MGFLKKLTDALLGGGDASDPYGIHFYVQCDRCGAVVHARADRRNELSRQYEGEATYIWRKGLIDDRCFQMMEAEVQFDSRHQIVSQEITGGCFITQEEYEQIKGE